MKAPSLSTLLAALLLALPARAMEPASKNGPASSPAEIHRWLLEDKIPEAHDAIHFLYKKEPRNTRVLVSMALVHMHFLETHESREYLDLAAKYTHGSYEVGLRMGDLEVLEGNFERGMAWYRRTLIRYPKDPLVRLNLAAALLLNQKVEEGTAEYRAGLAGGPMNREARLSKAIAEHLLGDLTSCAKTLDDYERSWGASSSTCFLRAMIHLKANQLELARTKLEEAGQRGSRNPMMVQQVTSVYLAMAMVPQARKLLLGAVELFPASGRLKDQFDKVDQRFQSEANTERKVVPPFVVDYDRSVDLDLVKRIVELCGEHNKDLSRKLGKNPDTVALKIYGTTGFSAPSYYNNLSGEIVVSAKEFQPESGVPASFVSHALHHEMAHFYAWYGKDRVARSVNSLWLEEGLAEFLSGGVDYLKDLKVDLHKVFKDGPLSLSDLLGNINVMLDARPQNLKAYVQSYLMVEYLVEGTRTPGSTLGSQVARVMTLLERVSQDISLAQALGEVYGMDLKKFEDGWKAHIQEKFGRR